MVQLGGLALVAIVLFLGPLIGTLAGAFVGWVVGLFFSDTILGILGQLGVHGVAMWQYGAFLGFTGAFFKMTASKSKGD